MSSPASARAAGIAGGDSLPAWVSVEGINGVGKTYLTAQLMQRLGPSCRAIAEVSDVEGEQFTGQVIAALAADGDAFLRTGHPLTETFALLALKVREYELVSKLAESRSAPRIVVEDRGIDSVALYQAVVLSGTAADLDATWAVAQHVYATASHWRPVPALTLLLVDDIDTCVDRYDSRGIAITADQRELVRRVADLYDRQSTLNPCRFRAIDRRELTERQVVDVMEQHVAELLATGNGCVL